MTKQLNLGRDKEIITPTRIFGFMMLAVVSIFIYGVYYINFTTTIFHIENNGGLQIYTEYYNPITCNYSIWFTTTAGLGSQTKHIMVNQTFAQSLARNSNLYVPANCSYG